MSLPGSALAVAPEVRRPVTFFISYAHRDDPAVESFLRLFAEMTTPSARYEYRLWRDRGGIPLGTDWHEMIQQALRECDFGLLLISPAFLGSRYIRQHELPPLQAKPVIPVALQRVSHRHDQAWLPARQWFFLDRPGRAPLTFGECGIARLRRRFVEALFEQVEQRLDAAFGR